ncbi:homoserine dehydrogenase [Ascosphaera apis ARSEF 7405]|uniref:Homoserine dehydrogenase n=1 Tax=Ascosphaera apis ARSEF 7405 TaxID=392613 RepID=A0A168B167_9EURO|nr:homoserine dehydrogenase [Ascosphaera apis ARSEF 7405]
MASKIFIGVIGTGTVGSEFLRQLAHLPGAPSLILISRAAGTITSPSPSYSPAIPANDWENATGTPYVVSSVWQPEQITEYMANAPGKAIIVDNTSDPKIAASYPLFLSKGISIITPNKKAFSSDYAHWKAIFETAEKSGAYVYHESTVGAGLPIISTLRELVATGDKVTKIEGVFSGTLSYLFNNFAPTVAAADGSSPKWSAVVAEAKKLGYTEPDPRDDLNGMDVARKCTILARIAGLEVESPASFPIQSLIPAELESIPATADGIKEFMQRLPEFDEQMEEIKAKAEAEGKVVRYVGSIDVASKSDNIISFFTERYGALPLVVQGAGAGAAVTAYGC